MVELGEIVCLYSELTIAELENAPEKVKKHFQKILNANTERVELTFTSRELATMYLQAKVVGVDKP